MRIRAAVLETFGGHGTVQVEPDGVEARLVDPFHDHAAMHLTPEIDVGGFGQEAERHLTLFARACVPATV